MKIVSSVSIRLPGPSCCVELNSIADCESEGTKYAPINPIRRMPPKKLAGTKLGNGSVGLTARLNNMAMGSSLCIALIPKIVRCSSRVTKNVPGIKSVKSPTLPSKSMSISVPSHAVLNFTFHDEHSCSRVYCSMSMSRCDNADDRQGRHPHPSQCAFAMSASVSPARIRAHAILNPRADQVIE